MAIDEYRVLRWHVSILRSVSVGGILIYPILRHVAKTDDIKDFVITEESSIAKGIRRVVAVTGQDANEISRKATEYERRLERIQGTQGKEKETALKAFYNVREDFMWFKDPLMISTGVVAEQHLTDSEACTQGATRQDQCGPAGARQGQRQGRPKAGQFQRSSPLPETEVRDPGDRRGERVLPVEPKRITVRWRLRHRWQPKGELSPMCLSEADHVLCCRPLALRYRLQGLSRSLYTSSVPIMRPARSRTRTICRRKFWVARS